MRNTILFGSILKNVFVVHQGTSAEKGALKVPGSMLQVNKCAPSQGCVSDILYRVQLEKFWRISLFLTDDAIAKLFVK